MFGQKKLISFSKLISFIVTSTFLLSACSNSNIEPSSKELASIDNPSKKTIKKLNVLIPLAMKWNEAVKKAHYSNGRILTKSEQKQAVKLGIKNPNAIRVVVLDKFPEPKEKAVNDPLEAARTIGNIIFIKPKHKNNSIVLCHELVHVAQADRLGVKQFIQRYALEHKVLGYSRSPLENEAFARQEVIQ